MSKGGRESHLNAVKKMFMKTTPFYDLNYAQNELRVRDILSCVLSSGITHG